MTPYLILGAAHRVTIIYSISPPCKSAACAIKEKLTGAYRKVSFASSEKMENSVEQSPWRLGH
jgi:hypothetical protein